MRIKGFDILEIILSNTPGAASQYTLTNADGRELYATLYHVDDLTFGCHFSQPIPLNAERVPLETFHVWNEFVQNKGPYEIATTSQPIINSIQHTYDGCPLFGTGEESSLLVGEDKHYFIVNATSLRSVLRHAEQEIPTEFFIDNPVIRFHYPFHAEWPHNNAPRYALNGLALPVVGTNVFSNLQIETKLDYKDFSPANYFRASHLAIQTSHILKNVTANNSEFGNLEKAICRKIKQQKSGPGGI